MTTMTIELPEEEIRLFKQLLKKLNGKVLEVKKAPKFLDELSESIQEMKLHQEGKLHLKSAKEILDEL